MSKLPALQIANRKALHEYHILSTYEAGIVLAGTEVTSLRAGKANLSDGWVEILNGEVFLRDVHISPYAQGNQFNQPEKRPRKLLLNRKEIVKLETEASEKGLTIIPLKFYDKGRTIKVAIAVAKGKKEYDKRETNKTRAANRDISRAMRRKQ